MNQETFKKEFKIEEMFDKYLELVKLDKRKMPSYQLRETRRAFFGAIGQLLIVQRDELTLLTEDESVEVLESFIKQVTDFWLSERGRQN